MARHKHWTQISKSPELVYKNDHTGATVRLLPAPSYYPRKWVGQLVHRGCVLAEEGFDRKRPEGREWVLEQVSVHEEPRLLCAECGQAPVEIDEEIGFNDRIKRAYSCDCGHESTYRMIYQGKE